MGSTNWGSLAKDAGDGPAPLPIGDYDIEVEAATYKTASTGSDMFNVTLVVINGPNKGRKCWNNIVLKKDSPNAVGMFFGTMRTLGLDAAFFEALPDDDEQSRAMICQALVGKRATVTTKHREWNGKTQTEVEKYKPLAGSAPAPAPAASAAPAAAPAAGELPARPF